MPIIRLHNPRTKRRTTKRPARRRSVRRNRNSLGEGVLTFMANPKRKRRSAVSHRRRRSNAPRRTVRHRARASNPMKRSHRRRSSRRRRNPILNPRRGHRRRRSNPMLPAFGDLKGLAVDTAYLAGGGITTRSIPQLLVPQYNTGFLGYGLNLLTATVSSALIGKWKPGASRPWLLGGFAFTLARILDDYAGLKILSFAQYTPPFQLAGDPRYGMAGVYASWNFPLPSVSQAYAALPPAAAVPANGVTVPASAGVGWDGSYN